MTDEIASLAILFLDVKGYSKTDVTATKQYVTKVLPLINDLLDRAVHRNTWGDAVLATFQSEDQAANAALDIRDLFRRLPADVLPNNLQPRIALNRGQVLHCRNPIRNEMDVFGPAVNLAARLETITLVGQIFCTESVYKALSDVSGLGSKATLYQRNARLPKDAGEIDVYVVTHRNEDPPKPLDP